MTASRRNLLLALALLVVSVVLFAVFVDLRAVARELAAADWRYLASASAALVAGLAVYALRWHWLLGSGVRGWHVFHAANVGHAVNVLVPFRAGEPVRIVALARGGGVAATAVTSSVVVERLLEQIMRLAALGGAVVFGLGLAVSPLTVGGAVVFLALAFAGIVWLRRHRDRVLARWPTVLGRLPRQNEARVRSALGGLLAGLEQSASPVRLLAALALSAAAWTCFWAFDALALAALPGDFDLRQVLTLSLGALALAPPSAPAQPGVYHASIVVPLGVVGFPETLLTAYAVVIHALLMGWMLGLGAWGMVGRGALAPHPPLPAAKGAAGTGGELG
jgi:uncharacterized protein (TIRG00374 family)